MMRTGRGILRRLLSRIPVHGTLCTVVKLGTTLCTLFPVRLLAIPFGRRASGRRAFALGILSLAFSFLAFACLVVVEPRVVLVLGFIPFSIFAHLIIDTVIRIIVCLRSFFVVNLVEVAVTSPISETLIVVILSVFRKNVVVFFVANQGVWMPISVS
jgi:hypothetical protein